MFQGWNSKHFFLNFFSESWVKKYSYFPESLRLEMLDESRKMFTFGYDSYMKYAFPKDELDPIHCTGNLLNKFSGKIYVSYWKKFQNKY